MSTRRTRSRRRAGSSLAAAAIAIAGATGAASRADAAPTIRVQLDQVGDFVLIGNTLGYECDAGTPAPIVGTYTGPCGANPNDTAPDVFWRSDSPNSDEAEANTGVTAANARTTAVLTLPPGATVTHAFLYWGARRTAAGSDTTVTVEREGAFSAGVTATASSELTVSGNNFYQSVANITSLVQTNGPGAYRVSDIETASFIDSNNGSNFAGWSMFVFYRLDGDSLRNLALYDGLDNVLSGSPVTQSITGFLVPNSPLDGKLGVFAYDGDPGSLNGDQLFFNGGLALTDGQNPSDNFFNGSRSYLGAAYSVAGDLPQLTGQPQSMGGIDIDVVNVKSKLAGGNTSATVQFSTSNDGYFVGAFATSIPTFRPDMSTSTKTATDLNGGALLPGDIVQYTITVTNKGSDASKLTALIDPLPMGVTYVAGSLQITQGVNLGGKTDAAGDDQGEYDGGARTVTVRLGMNANAAQGGSLAVNESTTVTFLVTVDAMASGIIQNQAMITAAGFSGATTKSYSTDGNGPGPGNPPTDIAIDACADNGQCAGAMPFCDIAATPNKCVECLSNADCPGLSPTCDPAMRACVCVPSGAELCDSLDNTCDGMIDEGNPGGGAACSTGLPGACDVGSTMCATGSLVCNVILMPGAAPEICGNAADEDCDGSLNNICPDTDADGLLDYIEEQYGMDPGDRDSDDDGLLDGDELLVGGDTDGDGLVNGMDPDSDNDGLFDGTELGKGCADAATSAANGHCRPDADAATMTDPLLADTDGGTVSDGSEDANLNGKVDAGEANPGAAGDDSSVVDTDKDGLSDLLEVRLRSSSVDADSDDDGTPDGAEANPSDDTDGDGLVNVLDVDSDNDAILDGTEAGRDCSNPATNKAAGHCKADADAATKTSPVSADSDGGGFRDGSEDTNLNGKVDAGEDDPSDSSSEPSAQDDSDGDGLTDALELTIGTKVTDADSDDDGALDGDEPNPNDDGDGDTLVSALDVDSDGDGLFDGLELGEDCSSADTDLAAMSCTLDGDAGATTTGVLAEDTDGGGLKDGEEDTNKDGVVDLGERDPNVTADDKLLKCEVDADCGGKMSGKVCDAALTCVDGCRGTGNGCPAGLVCSSSDSSIGTCGDGAGGGGQGGSGQGGGAQGSGGQGGAGAAGSGGDGGGQGGAVGGLRVHGNGLLCAAPRAIGESGGSGDVGAGWLLLAIAGGSAMRRRRHGRAR